MKNFKKIMAGVVLSLGVLALAIPVNAAARGYSVLGSRYNNNGYYMNHYNNGIRDLRSIRSMYPMVRLQNLSNQNLRNMVLGSYYENTADQNLAGEMFAKRVVIVDRNDTTSQIVITNQNTGPFSVNRVVIAVDSDFFNQISTLFDSITSNDIEIVVDTGNNSVSMNTVAGDVMTGEVAVEIAQ